MSSSAADDTRARIVEATITCIQREGIESVTSRSISKEANVNLAALNYYFGSKERILELALARALQSAFTDSLADFDRFFRRHEDVREAMVSLLDDTIEGAGRFANLGFALVHETVAKQRYDTPFVVRMNAFLEQLFERVGTALRGDTDDERRASLAQLWSTVIVIGIMPRVFDQTLRKSLDEPTARLLLVRSMVDCHFAAENAAPRRVRDPKAKRKR